MNNTDLHPTGEPRTPDAPAPSRRTGRTRAIVATSAVGLVAIAGTGIAILSGPETEPLVLDTPNAVVSGQTFDRPIEIAADNIRLQRVTVRAGGAAAIRIRSDVAGATIVDTEIHCTDGKTDGIVPGDYSAVRVTVHDCRRAFVQDAGAAATIVDSEQNGEAYSPDVPGGVEAAPSPPEFGPVAPMPSAPRAPDAVPPTPITYWPGPTNTGVPAGTVLTNSGSLDLRTAGQVLTNLNIVGCVTVRASNIIIRKSRITCNSPTYSIRLYDTAINLVVEDVEINGAGRNSASVCCGNYTLRRANVWNMIDGPRLSTKSTIVDSWIHDLARIPGSHNDALQTTGGSNIIVRHNRLEPYTPSTNDPHNACIMIGSTTADAVRNLTFEDNYCNGGNYSIGVRDDLVSSNIIFRNNKFGRNYRYGVIARPDQTGILWDRPTNVWFDTGLPVVP
ncbi:right-handed parallel beta-helix repeat-containing protein [Micromonospora sp. NBC_01796]|uniref:right-handed parallel beta-helix repeat-containing protein n=1 Tax=Micromonospora sp. NBC_01796 TaxID=2975987 RepID=UPI002DDC3687|nr:right-handed parallel beta-helix repeat-containing protein [Micromonospora sp. NBC_01796]WSA89119.1 right-handed parallel beta-helix repeat-containing protein [Micromonospora sp. NBC_01796]